jgi:hypothetical protein
VLQSPPNASDLKTAIENFTYNKIGIVFVPFFSANKNYLLLYI